jgi:hypothetical protein
MSEIFKRICSLGEQLDKIISRDAILIEKDIDKYDWYNRVYTSKKFRRAHIEVLDKIEEHNMLIVHATIFPHINDASPIFGFDIICTGKKISAIFHDFSPTTDPDNFLMHLFNSRVKKLNLPTTRDLPEWAKSIFSPNMIASRTITDDAHIDQIIDTVMLNLKGYILWLGDVAHKITEEECDNDIFIRAIVDMQNRYCEHQRKNPYPVKMLKNFGLTEEDAIEFVNKHLFPTIMKYTTEEQLYMPQILGEKTHKAHVPEYDIIKISNSSNQELLRITPSGEVIAPSLEAASEAGRVFVDSLRGNIGFLKNKD